MPPPVEWRERRAGRSSGFIAMNRIGGEGRGTDSNVFRAAGFGRAVADPLAAGGRNGLAVAHVQSTVPEFDSKHAVQDNRVFVEVRVWPGSTQPPGLRMCATLIAPEPVFTRPTNSSISFGLLPAAAIRVGCAMS
jgi:hypothetical protein